MTPDEMNQLMALGDDGAGGIADQINPKPKAPNPQDNESLKKAWEFLKQGQFAKAAMAVPGQDMGRAFMGGELGPLNGPAAALVATASPLAGAGGTWPERFALAQKQQREAMARHPWTAAGGGLLSGIAAPLPGVGGGATSVLGKGAAGAVNGALQGGATTAGLGEGVGPGAAIGGAIGGLGGTLGGLLSKAAHSEALSPLLNRLKFLKPSPEEAQPLGAGGDIRDAIQSTSDQGLWKGLPSREGMLDRLQSAQGPAGQKIGDVLSHADTVNGRLPEPVEPNMSFPKSGATLRDLMSHSSASGDNPERLMGIAQQEQGNAAGAQSLAALNKAKQGIYGQTYTPNAPENASFLPGRDKLLRATGLDVKNSIQGSLDNLSQIDPSVDAAGFANANKQYGQLSDLMGPLNRAVGKEVAGGGGSNIRAASHGSLYGNIGEMLNFGGKRQLAQAHAGEALQGAEKSLSTFKPSQVVAKAFIAGTTPGLNNEGDDLENQP
jgi:hypothetical protein